MSEGERGKRWEWEGEAECGGTFDSSFHLETIGLITPWNIHTFILSLTLTPLLHLHPFPSHAPSPSLLSLTLTPLPHTPLAHTHSFPSHSPSPHTLAHPPTHTYCSVYRTGRWWLWGGLCRSSRRQKEAKSTRAERWSSTFHSWIGTRRSTCPTAENVQAEKYIIAACQRDRQIVCQCSYHFNTQHSIDTYIHAVHIVWVRLCDTSEVIGLRAAWLIGRNCLSVGHSVRRLPCRQTVRRTSACAEGTTYVRTQVQLISATHHSHPTNHTQDYIWFSLYCEQVIDTHRPLPSTFLFLREEELKKEFVVDHHPFPPPALH